MENTEKMMKLHVNNAEESIKVQRQAFRLGYSWGYDGTVLENLGYPYLWVNANDMTVTYSGDELYFMNHKAKFITVEDFLSIKIPLYSVKLFSPEGDNILFQYLTEEKYKVIKKQLLSFKVISREH